MYTPLRTNSVKMTTSRYHRHLAIGVALLAVVVLILGCLMLATIVVNSMDDQQAEKIELAQKVVSALKRAIDHLFLVGDRINFDAVFTVRIMEGQLAAFHHQKVLRGSSWVNARRYANLLERVDQVQGRARTFQEQFISIAQKNQPSYFQGLAFELKSGSWNLWYPLRDIDRSSMPTYGFDKTFHEELTEELTDECLKEISTEQCHFTEKCWMRMTQPFYHGYSLTHEVLFILNAFAFGCKEEAELAAEKWSKMSTDALLAKECAAVLYEAELFASRNFSSYRRDLFLEQISLCGILGYRDFFRNEWLEEILGWQSKKGCYMTNQSAVFSDYLRDFPYARMGHYRQKRNEVQLADGCSAHKTGVALTALGQYIRFLLESLLK